MFSILDATGSGACRVRRDGGIASISPGFSRLTGLAEDTVGSSINELLATLPALVDIPDKVDDGALAFRQLGSDGVARELVPVLSPVPGDDGDHWLVLVDRSGEARLERQKAQLGRQVEDLRHELEARADAPVGTRVRTTGALAGRLDEAVRRARRYDHAITVLLLHIDGAPSDDSELGAVILGCIRGVDEVGVLGDTDYAIVLPHTDLAGSKVVGERIRARLGELGANATSLGAAQLVGEETASALVTRAEQACYQAQKRGGGIMVAVDVS